MGFISWFGQNWFTLLQSTGIIAGLIFTAVSFRVDTRSRRVDHLITLTENYRNIWSGLLQRPELGRIFSESVDYWKSGVSREEEILIRLLIFHLNTVYHARKARVLFGIGGVEQDIRWFFSRPLPRLIWERTKPFQDQSFVAFVEGCLHSKRK